MKLIQMVTVIAVIAWCLLARVGAETESTAPLNTRLADSAQSLPRTSAAVFVFIVVGRLELRLLASSSLLLNSSFVKGQAVRIELGSGVNFEIL